MNPIKTLTYSEVEVKSRNIYEGLVIRGISAGKPQLIEVLKERGFYYFIPKLILQLSLFRT